MEEIKQGYTRVSSILGQWDKFGHIDKDVLARKAAIGTRIHETIKDHIDGIFSPLDDNISGYLDSYLLWEKNVKPEIIQSEKRYYCDKMMITGQVDCIARLPGESLPILIDFKTSVQESPTIWPLQAGFYHHLSKVNGLELSDRVLFLRLSKKGELPVIHEYIVTKSLWNVCLASWICYRHLNP